jgi:dihydroorotate dehydrogenase (NAD+) catalytic subunit
LLERCRAETSVPLLAKLTPSVADLPAIGLAAAEGGADGLVLINTVRGMAIDRTTLRPLLGGGGGGLSGPAVKPVALHAIYHAHAVTGLPIIGLGGIESAQDCIEFAAAGASVVALGTALFRDPGLLGRVVEELPRLLGERGVSTFDDIVGAAHHSVPHPILEVDGEH